MRALMVWLWLASQLAPSLPLAAAGLWQDGSAKQDPPTLPPGTGLLVGVCGVLCVLLVVYECAGRGLAWRYASALLWGKGRGRDVWWQPQHDSAALPTPITRSLPTRRAPLGWAAEFRALDIIRSSDERVQGVCAVVKWADEHAPDVPLSSLLTQQAGCKVVVLGLVFPQAGVQEEEAVVLIEIPQGVDVLQEPFLDRGVRKVAGTRAFVTFTASLAQYFNSNNNFNNDSSGSISDDCPQPIIWVWNTGRCGSTLVHRLLLACGVCSLSEPYWAEQLCRHRDTLGQDNAARLLGLCLRTDSMLLHHGDMTSHTQQEGSASASAMAPRTSRGSGYGVALNPKGNGHALLPLAPHCLPTHFQHKHVFLYRACVGVVESLGSVLQSDASVLTSLRLQLHPNPLVRPLPFVSHTLRSWLSTGVLKRGCRDRLASLLTLLWLDALCTWREALDSHTITPTLLLRMDELVRRDLREVMATKVLELSTPPSTHGPPPPPDEAMLHKLLAVFERHSQAGDRMMRSSAVTGQRFLSPQATQHIHTLLASLPDAYRDVATARLPHSFMMMQPKPKPTKEEEEKEGDKKGEQRGAGDTGKHKHKHKQAQPKHQHTQ